MNPAIAPDLPRSGSIQFSTGRCLMASSRCTAASESGSHPSTKHGWRHEGDNPSPLKGGNRLFKFIGIACDSHAAAFITGLKC